MKKKLKMACHITSCFEEIFSGGLCEEHHQEYLRKTKSNEAAREALFTLAVEGRIPDDSILRDELSRLRRWCDKACNAIRIGHDVDGMPFAYAEAAYDWCIALAREIVDAEIAFRNGKPANNSLAVTRLWVWENFQYLENGLVKKAK